MKNDSGRIRIGERRLAKNEILEKVKRRRAAQTGRKRRAKKGSRKTKAVTRRI